METTRIYSLCLGGIVVFLLIFRACHTLFSSLQKPIQHAVDTLLFPRPRGGLSCVQPKTWSRFTLLILYVTGTITSNTIFVTNISEAGTRAGKICLANLIPLLVCNQELGSRLLGISFDLYHSIHRTLGVMAFVQGMAHALISLMVRSANLHDTSTIYGVIAVVVLTAVMLTSTFKSPFYEVFIHMHTVCSIGLVFAVWEHVTNKSTSSTWYVVGIASVYALTALVRLIRIIVRNLTLRAHTECMVAWQGNNVEVTIYPARPWTVRAGESVSLGIPGAGFLSWFPAHPFTIAWWEKTETETSITVLIRPRSGFTKKLNPLPNKRQLAWIDGPYGSELIGRPRMGDYGHVFMVATGIGIAAQLPHMKDLIEGYQRGLVRTQRMILIWQLDAAEDYDRVNDWLQSLVAQDRGRKFHMHIFDPSRSSDQAPECIGKHDMIKIWGGRHMNWQSELEMELQKRIGAMLITVSARSRVRNIFRKLSLKHRKENVELLELDFQPWELKRSIWSCC